VESIADAIRGLVALLGGVAFLGLLAVAAYFYVRKSAGYRGY
jgi:hypothetical protein